MVYVHYLALDEDTKWVKKRWESYSDYDYFLEVYGEELGLILIDGKLYKITLEEIELDPRLDIKREKGKILFSGYYYDDNTTLLEQLAYHI